MQILFYCSQNKRYGLSLIVKAAKKSHAAAMYSLALIQFNGSGGSKSVKNLKVGARLCQRAVYLGCVDANREFGHCLQDGYGVSRDVSKGHHLLHLANAHDIGVVFSLVARSQDVSNDNMSNILAK
ncbi:hypothetical protein GIB67_009353 [Kingdonia uniflora]|uniref:F-box protein n=1 Tax=Kingdonia uniflora TaxID=39325 RepID=A0A7J7N341_9MAGN|nr:hypothetical protein GIB67_009353 [Kingdonia uniflora]